MSEKNLAGLRQRREEETAKMLERASALEPLIRDCFLNRDMSSVDVGRLCGLRYSTIIKYARLLGIPVQTRSEAARKRRGSLLLTGELQEILDGELLGDGCLMKQPGHSAFFTYTTPKGAYLDWLSALFLSHGMHGSVYGPYPKPISKPAYQYTTKRYPELNDVYTRWYPQGNKCVPRDLVLTPTMCRHWYIGDGNIKKPPAQPHIVLCTHGFTIVDVEYLAALLTPYAPGVHLGKAVTAGPPLELPKRAALGFLDYIGPCPEPLRDVYGYKWRLTKNIPISLPWKPAIQLALGI